MVVVVVVVVVVLVPIMYKCCHNKIPHVAPLEETRHSETPLAFLDAGKVGTATEGMASHRHSCTHPITILSPHLYCDGNTLLRRE